MKPSIIKLFIIICLFIASNIYGSNSYFFQQLNISHGLSQSKVNCIYYDYKGYLWIGTPYGLNCYDRNEIKQFFNIQDDVSSLPSNEILFIKEDKEHNLWIGTFLGLCKYDRKNSRFERIKYNGNQLIAYSVLSFNDELYFGGSGQLYKYQPNTNQIIDCNIDTGNNNYTNFTEMAQIDENNIIINTNRYGIFKYNVTTRKLLPLEFIPKGNSQSIFVDSYKRLWVSEYGKGIYCFKDEQLLKHFTTKNSSLKYDVILTMEEKDGYLWLGTDGAGIQFISLKDLTFRNIFPETEESPFSPSNAVNTLYKDPMNNMWAGTIRFGVVYIYEVNAKSYKKVSFGNVHGLSNQTINCIFEDKEGIIWLGTDGGGLNSYDTKNKKFKHYLSNRYEKVTSIIEYSSTELLIFLFNKGIFIFNKESGKIYPFEHFNQGEKYPSVHNGISTFIHELSNDQILFSNECLTIYNKRTQQFTLIGKRGKEFERFSPLIRESKDGEIFIVDHVQILSLDKDTHQLSVLYRGNEAIQGMSIDNHKNIWIATQKGLVQFSLKTGKTRKIKPNLLTSVNTVVADNTNYLWIGTSSNRLFLYDITTDLLSLVDESDGFITNEYSFGSMFISSKDEVFIGGTMGLTIADKQMANKHLDYVEQKENSIELVDIFVNGKPYNLAKQEGKKTISLPWDFYSLQLKFMVKEDNIFRKHAFRYLIDDGNNEEEIHSFSNSLTIHALREGDHTVAASYITQRGEWSAPIILAHVQVVPAWWKSNFFYMGISILSIGIIFSIIFGLLNHEEKTRKREINKLNNKIAQDRIRFLVNIGHELKTPLTLISAPLKHIIEHDIESSYLSQKLENIYKQSIKIKELVDLVLDVKKLKDGEEVLHLVCYPLNLWLKEVTDQFKDELNNHSMTLQYQLDDNINSITFDKEKCNIIINNMIMNAIKFSKDNTTIIVRSELTDSNMVRISVIDEGIGLKDEDIPKLFSFYYQGKEKQSGSSIGLSYCKILTDLHNGKIGAFRNKTKGSTFYFELPKTTENGSPFEAEVAVQCPLPKDSYDILKIYSILIIIENNDLRLYLKDVLKDSFNHVYVAKNGVEGMEFIKKYSPDIVASDAIMSKMSGFMVCKAVKENKDTCHIPIVLLTAYFNQTNMQTGYRMGADAFVSKPFDIDTLLSIISNELKLREAIKQRYQVLGQISNSPKDIVINNADEEFIEKFNGIIENNIMNANLNVDFLTKELGISRTALFNKIKDVTNLGIIDYVNSIRIKKSMELLQNTKLNITEISEMVGFSYPQYFGKVFKKLNNISPSEYRNVYYSQRKESN